MTTRNTIVAVGGTGTHVAIAFLRMAILSNMSISDVPNIIVVDGDTAGANQNDRSLMSVAKDLFDQVVSGADARSRPAWLHFVPYRASGEGEEALAADTEFGDYLLAQPRATAPLEERQILDSLFTRPVEHSDGELSEQEIKIRDGFSARPSVGATAMYDLLADAGRRPGLLPVKLRELIGRNGYAGIAVVGSSSGGTGSGAGPALAQWLQNEMDRRQNQAEGARLGLFMTLPWFFPDDTPSETVEAPAGTRENQRLNAAAGIRLYRQSPTLDRAGVFLTDYFGIQTIRENDGNARQRENPHPVPLLLSAQIQNFFLAAERSLKEDAPSVRGEFTFFNQARSNRAEDFIIDGANSPLVAFSREANVRQDLQDWAIETQSLRIILTELAGFIGRDYRDDNNGAERTRPDQFKQLMLRLAQAKHGEAGSVKRSVLFGLGGGYIEVPQVRKDLAKAIEQRVSELTDSIVWLSEVERNSEASGHKSLKLDRYAIEARLEPSDCRHFSIFEKGNDPRPIVNSVFVMAFDPKVTAKTEAPADGCVRFFDQLIEARDDAVRMDADTAAVHVIERQIRALMQVGQEKRINIRATDSTSDRLQAGMTAQYLVPLQSGEQPVNQYLAKIEMGRLVDESNDRSGARLHSHDPSHPFTVTGLKSRAIPSPWAAAHRQAWERLYGNAALKASSRASVEAVMWATFTKRLVLKRLDIQRTRLGRMLKSSLESELHHQGVANLDHILVAVDSKDPENVVATNHPLVGWFIAPWIHEEASREEKQQWWRLSRFNFEVPTEQVKLQLTGDHFMLRQIRSFVDALLTLRNHHRPNANAAQGIDIPWYADVAELIALLEPSVQNVQPVPQQAPSVGEQMMLFGLDGNRQMHYPLVTVPVLHQSLHEILDTYVPKELASIETITAASSGGVRHPDLPVFGHRVGLVEDCVGPTEISTSADGETFLLRYELSLRGLGRATVERASRRVALPAYLGIFPNFKADGWNRYMLGCIQQPGQESANDFRFTALTQDGISIGQVERRFATNQLVDQVPAYVLLHVHSSTEQLEGEVGCFSTRLKDLTANRLSFQLGLDIGTSHSCFFAADANGRPIAGVDFSKCGQDLTEVMFSQGYLQDLLDQNSMFLGAHSSIYGGNEQRVLPSELKVQVRSGGVAPPDMLSSEEPAGHFTVLPYEYRDAMAQTRRGAQGEYLSDFKWKSAIAGAKYHGLKDTNFEDHQREVLGVYLEHVLWMGFAMLRRNGYRRLGVLRVTYPEAFNNMQLTSYAEVLMQTLGRAAKLTGVEVTLQTRGGAIGADNLTHTDMMPVQAQRQGALLVRPTPGHSCFVSESLAAICASPLPVGNDLRGITLVLDMGGGTTDVALYSFTSEHDERVALKLPSLTDSVQYAGNDVVAMLNTDAVYRLMVQPLQPGGKIDTSAFQDEHGAQARLTVIKRLMRNPRAMRGLREAMLNGELPRQSMQVNAFFDGLVSYAATLAMAYRPSFEDANAKDKHWSVNVILLGNGWRLTDLIHDSMGAPAERFLQSMTQTIKKHLGSNFVEVHASFNSVNGVSVKEAIAFGALHAHEVPPNLSAVSSASFVAGFPLQLVTHGETRQFAPHEILEIGLSQRDFQQPNRLEIDRQNSVLAPAMMRAYLELMKHSGHDEQRQMSNLALSLNNRFTTYVRERWLQPTDMVKLSPFGLFLEHHWKQACQTADL